MQRSKNVFYQTHSEKLHAFLKSRFCNAEWFCQPTECKVEPRTYLCSAVKFEGPSSFRVAHFEFEVSLLKNQLLRNVHLTKFSVVVADVKKVVRHLHLYFSET